MKRGWPAYARLLLVVGALAGAWWLFPGLRRVDLELRLRDAEAACAERVHVRIGQEGRVDHALRLRVDGPALPPWRVALRPGAHRLEGEVVCASGEVRPIPPRTLEVASEGALTLGLRAFCRC